MGATFTRIAGSRLWSLDGEAEAVAVALLPFENVAPPETVTLADAWSVYRGTFLVLPRDTPLDDTLAAKAAWVRRASAPATLRLAWVPNPRDEAPFWRTAWIVAAGGHTVGLSQVPFRNLNLWIGAGLHVGPNPSGDALVVEDVSGLGSLRLSMEGVPPFEKALTGVDVAFAGRLTGCLTAQTVLHCTEHRPDLDLLDVGMRIFEPVPRSPIPNRLRSWRFPVFRGVQEGDEGTLAIDVALDPIAPLDSDRTFFGLTRCSELSSWFVTTGGEAVALAPLDAPAARLVLAERALSDPPGRSDPLYLVPSGAFSVSAAASAQLLCGISGIEYMTISPGAQMWFSPGGAALARPGGLAYGATTAYVTVFDDKGGRYHAQPDDSPLFAKAASKNLLGFHELNGIPLSKPPEDAALPAGAPMVALSGVAGGPQAEYASIETAAVAPARRSALGGDGSRRAVRRRPRDATTAVTPQGLLVDVTANGLDVTLVRSQDGRRTLKLQASTVLEDALQTNQLFLVASDPGALQRPNAPAPDGTVSIPALPDGNETWDVTVFPAAAWDETRTLVVLKFSTRPLRELAADVGAWASAAALNPGKDGVARAQRVLEDAISTAEEREGGAAFEAFASLSRDPQWTGILFLNCPLATTGLPRQMAGLAPGLAGATLAAHHVGLTTTPLATTGEGEPRQEDSALFGLLAYESMFTAAGAAGPFAFNVASLRVGFRNSAVDSFSSRIELRADELFGDHVALVDPATDRPAAANVLVLDGVYQQRGGSAAYAFSSSDERSFVSGGAVVESVEVTGAEFVTVTAAGIGAEGTAGESRFLLSGRLRFRPRDGFDPFSFGSVEGAGSLSFSNAAVVVETGSDPSARTTYRFDATRLVLDGARSRPRPGSLFAAFPLTLAGFVQGGSTRGDPVTTAGLGYAGVRTPLGEAPLGDLWFGLVADLSLGTSGSLSTQPALKASLLVAWAPGPGSPRVAVGLKLPGAGGTGKLFGIQDVVKLKVGALELAWVGGQYILRLSDMTVNVLALGFPPGGVDALLFGDPSGTDDKSMGWYAGYAEANKR